MISIPEKELAECEAIYSERTASFRFPKYMNSFSFGNVSDSDFRRIFSKLNRMKNKAASKEMKSFIQSMTALFVAAEKYQDSSDENDGIGDEAALETFRKLSGLSFSPLYPDFIREYNS